MASTSELVRDFLVEIERSDGWESSGAQVIPILKDARDNGGDALLVELVDAIVGAGVEDAATAALAYLGDVIREAGPGESSSSFALLTRYLSADSASHERLGASAGLGSIMDNEAASRLRRAATAEPLEELAAFQRRSAEVIERNVAAHPENPNAFALAV